MPKAAQYYPTPEELSSDNGIDLGIYQCSDCGLVQLDCQPVDYFRDVITAASLSEKNRIARLEQMQALVSRFQLKGKKAIEVGCARGEMLDVIAEAGLDAVGIEASRESVEIGQAAGRKMLHGYIGDVEKIDGGPYDAFICLNYFEHLPNPAEIIKIIRKNLTDDGVGFVTVPNLEFLLRSKCFYEFVADHLSYFTQKTLTHAFESNGFDVVDCRTINEDNDIAVTVKKKTPGLLTDQYEEVRDLCKNLKQLTLDYKRQNKRIAVWGAGHRTLALLALSELKDIAYIVDSAKFKQGKLSPVTHFEIVAPSRLLEKDVDLVIVMVPGLYPKEVLKTLNQMNLGVQVATLEHNRIVFQDLESFK
ncbi:MAG: methyltransferase domain-containing protein [Bacteriovoracia bacterium]